MIKLPAIPLEALKMPSLRFNVKALHVKQVMKSVQFIDIETNTKLYHLFGAGHNHVGIHQMLEGEETKILTVAGGSFYDLYESKKKGVWSLSNHHFKRTFKKDPEDDTEVLRRVWKIMDEAKVIVAHNGSFDEGWLRGRFVMLGWKQPSPFALVCTYRGLRKYRMDSKKLDYLSQKLCKTKKITTDMALWMACKAGDVKAFQLMEKYNIGDIYDTLFKVYMKTCQYYPQYAVDMTDHELEIPQCRVTGKILRKLPDLYTNHTTGKQYHQYINDSNGIIYVDRYNINSKMADLGKIKELVK